MIRSFEETHDHSIPFERFYSGLLGCLLKSEVRVFRKKCELFNLLEISPRAFETAFRLRLDRVLEKNGLFSSLGTIEEKIQNSKFNFNF